MSKGKQIEQGTKNILCKECESKRLFTRIGCCIGYSDPLTCTSCKEEGGGDERICPPKDAPKPMRGTCLTCTGSPGQVYAAIERKQEKDPRKKEKKRAHWPGAGMRA